MSLLIRPATLDDADAACAVLRQSITLSCGADHQHDPALLAAWLRNKTPDNVRRWLQTEGSIAVVAELTPSADAITELVGFANCSAEGEVLLCYILPRVRFTGVGKALLAAIERQARANGLSRLWLESTVTGQDFYLRQGFTPSGPPQLAFGMPGLPMEKWL